jgi:hypothetical protein
LFAVGSCLAAACAGPSPAGELPDGGADTTDALAEEVDAEVSLLGSEYVFDEDTLRTYELEIAAGDWEWLNENALLEEYVPATLLFEGDEYGPIGVRYKGGFGTLTSCFNARGERICPKLSFKLKFNLYDDEGRFYGLKKLNFHSMKADPTAMHDRLAYSLYREMGVDAPRAVHARLIVNGELIGLFALIEQIDGRLTRSRFPDGGEGNLYKEVWPIHDYEQPYLDALKTNEDEAPEVSKMIRFASALASATDETIVEVLEEWTDLDALMAYLAVDRAIENWDGIVGFWCIQGGWGNHNYYWYEEIGRDKVWLIPWDLDNTFDVPNMFIEYFDVPAWDELPDSCDCVSIFDIGSIEVGRQPAACDDLVGWLGSSLRERYLDATRVFLDCSYRLEVLNGKIDHYRAQIAAAVAEDPNGPHIDEWTGAVQGLRADLATLRGQLEAAVAE